MEKKNRSRLTGDGGAKERVSRVDPYGFQRSEDFDFEAYEELMSEYLVVLTRRAIRWSKLLKNSSKLQRSPTVKRYIRKGVPNQHRSLVWMWCSGAQDRLDQNPGYYQSLLGGGRDPRLEDTIRTDLNRTFPDNIHFQRASSPSLLKSLYNVLLAYGHHHASVGYCQGMNFIAGLLLIITKDEEKSFWLMEALLGRILPDYYSPAMVGLKMDQEVLGELVKVKAPQVWRTLVEQNVTWTLVVSRWFICLYIDVLPVETVLRVWDCLFYEGSKILFRVALTLILLHQDSIQQAGSLPDVCQAFKQASRSPAHHRCHAFMQNIFSSPGSLSSATLTKLRAACRSRVLEEEP